MSTASHVARPGVLVRWARFSVRNRWKVLIGWLLGIVVLGVLTGTLAGDYSTAFTLPGAESQTAIDLLDERFPTASGDSATMVFQAAAGINDPAVKQQIDAILAETAKLPEVVSIESPYENASAINQAGNLGFATIQYDKPANDVKKENAEALIALVERSGGNGLTVEVGGSVASVGEGGDLGSAELIGIAVAIVIMLLMFGSIIATGLPIITALIGVVIGTMVAMLLTNGFTLNKDITPAFLSMMGLGVGIDYTLFIVNRYRDGLLKGDTVEQAVWWRPGRECPDDAAVEFDRDV